MLERSCRWPLLIGKASVAAYMHPVQLQGDDHTQGCRNNNKEKKKKER
jgi:hypothetical protein